ncbi:MAG: 5-oxoprolinase subunit PxpA [Syntrophobacteraceae bacterium]|nr:5-oxoprolinase subunit PxpA [Syntrophobacteraceae bacterium]
MRIDINCDMGESFGPYRMGEDEQIIRHITSASIACGFHAGDPRVMARTVELAREHGVAVGAHPGYPDLIGFGRRNLETAPGQIKHDLLYQLGALSGFTRALGMGMQHVKPHGALYNLAARDERAAGEVIDAVLSYDPELVLFVLAGSLLEEMAGGRGLRVAREIFPDRAYLSNGQLAPRSMAGAVIHDLDAVCSRLLKLLDSGRMECIDGGEIPLQADTLCVHGDTPGAWRIAASIRQLLKENGHEAMPVRS